MRKIIMFILFFNQMPFLLAQENILKTNQKTASYIILTEDQKKAGEYSVTSFGNGHFKVNYIFKDNGRGPEIAEDIQIDSSGYMKSYKAIGSSTMGNTINEKFEVKNKLATWSSQSEKGTAPYTENAFYIPLNSSPHLQTMLIEALFKSNTKNKLKKLKLLPSGELSMRQWTTLQVTSKNKNQKVQLISLSGLGLTPSFVWVTTGKNPEFFALIDPGYRSTINDEWKNNIKILETEQKKINNKLIIDLAARLQHPMNDLTVITNVRLFDSLTATVTEPKDVSIYRGRITSIKPAGSKIESAIKIIDGTNKLLSPGLFDMHGHLGEWEGSLHIAGGVTTIRDLGNSNVELQSMIDKISLNLVLAPQIVPAGFLEGESSYSARIGFVIKDLNGAKKAVDWYAEHGYPQLKIYNSFPKEILKDTVSYAHSRGMRVSGHVPAFLKAQDVIDAGFDEIQHINQVLLNFLVKPETDTRTLARFYLPAEKVVDLDFNSTPVKNFIQSLVKNKIVIDPTLTVFDFIKQKDGEVSEPFAPIMDHMPPDIKRGFYQGSMKMPDEATAARYLKSYQKMVEFVGIMHKNKIPLVAGTDSFAGFALHSELELYVKAGLTPAEALQVATLNGATYTRTLNDRGTISTGKLADLVLFDGDPTKNISDIRKVSLVITRGQLIYPNEIYSELGIKPFVKSPPKMESLIKE